MLVAIRENPERVEMLGYDVRRTSSPPSCSAVRSPGSRGVLYTAWGQYITPSSMGLMAAALPVIWVVGRRAQST